MHVTMRATAVVVILAALTAIVIGCGTAVQGPAEGPGDPGVPGDPGDRGFARLAALQERQQLSSDDLYELLEDLIDLMTEFKQTVSQDDFALHADAVDDALEQMVEGLQDMEPQEFSDGLDEVAQALYDALGLLQDEELPDIVYDVIRLVEPRHVPQLVTIIDLAREIADEGVQQIGEYRRVQTLQLLDDVAKELDRLGSKEKLRTLLYIVSERAPEVVVEELNRLGVGDTLAPAVTAVGQILDEVAQFIEDNVL